MHRLTISFLAVVTFLSSKPLKIPRLFWSYPRIIRVKYAESKGLTHVQNVVFSTSSSPAPRRMLSSPTVLVGKQKNPTLTLILAAWLQI
jgi:hypothetical protein